VPTLHETGVKAAPLNRTPTPDKTDTKAAPVNRASACAPDPDGGEDDIDRILGSRALFTLREAVDLLRVSPPTMYRAMRQRRVEYVMSCNRRQIKRLEMKRLLRNGLGPLAG
jgi:hypothetical protein